MIGFTAQPSAPISFAKRNEQATFREDSAARFCRTELVSAFYIICLVLLALHTPRAFGQGTMQIQSPDTAIGESPFAAYDSSGIDNVNAVNGNLYLKIPILSFPQIGRDLRLQFRIFSNDKGWMIHYQPYTTADGVTHYQNGTWFLPDPTGVYIARDQYVSNGITDSSASSSYDTNIGGSNGLTTYLSYFAKSADGSLHYVADLSTQSCSSYGGGEVQCPSLQNSSDNIYPATDGTGYKLAGSASTLDRDGITYTSSGSSVDANGNSISIGTNGWTDTVGRVIPGNKTGVGVPSYSNPAWSTPANTHAPDLIPGIQTQVSSTSCPAGTDAARIWSVPLPPGSVGNYYLCYQKINYSSTFVSQFGSEFTYKGYSITDSAVNSTEALIAIVLPNGTSYTFTYDSYLSLTSVTLPTGGKITYSWQNVPFWFFPNIGDYNGEADAFLSAPISRAIQTRTVYPGGGAAAEVWTYNWVGTYDSHGIPDYTKAHYSIVTDPLGNDTEHVLGGTDINGNKPTALTETATNYYQGCSPHNTAPNPTCNSSMSTLLKSDQYALTPIASGGAQYGSNSYDSIVNPAWKVTSTQTTIYAAGGSNLVSKVVDSLTPAYGTCTVSSVGPVALGGSPNPPPAVTTQSPCYQLDQDASVATYDFGLGSAGSLLKTETTNYLWNSTASNAAAYAAANLLDLVSSSVTTNGAGSTLAETEFTYDESSYASSGQHGNLTSLTKVNLNGPSPIEHGYYNSNGLLTKALDARAYATSITAFQCNGSLPQTITDALGHQSSYTFDCGTGVLSQYQNSNDLADAGPGTTYTYDAVRNPIYIKHPDGGTVQISYNGYAVPWLVTKTTSAAPDPNIVSSIQYDGFLKPSITTMPNGATSETTYDLLGRKHTVTNPHFSTQSSTDGTTTYVNDLFGRVVEAIHPDGSTLWSCYNGVATNQQPNCGSTPATVIGTWTNNTDEAKNTSQRTSDALGRLTKVLEQNLDVLNYTTCGPQGCTTRPAFGAETDYAYDAIGNLVTVNQLGVSGSDTARTRSFTYDSLSRLICASNPETSSAACPKIASANYTAGTTGYSYDANGNLVTKTDARNVAVSFVYDGLNRVLTKKAPAVSGTPAINDGFTYDTANSIAAKGGVGHLVSTSSASGASEQYAYDLMGRMISKAAYLPSSSSTVRTVSAVYDLAGNATTFTYPDGRTTSQSFDGAGRMISASYQSWNGTSINQPYLTVNAPYFTETNGYDPASHLINATFGNGVQFGAAYDNRERLNKLGYGPSTAPAWSKQLAWTSNGNLQSQTDLITGVQRQFSYDGLNRLTAAQDIYSNLAVASGSNDNTGSTSTNGSGASETPGGTGALPEWTNPDDSNLLTDIGATNSTWTKGGAVIAASSVAAPDGSMTATTVTSNSSDAYVQDSPTTATYYSLETMTGSVWLRSISGTQVINLYIVADYPGGYTAVATEQVTLSTTWKQYQLTHLLPDNVTAVFWQIGGGSSVGAGGGFIMWHPMLEDEGVAGSSVTNFLPYSQRLTASSWTPGSATTVVGDNVAVAPDGTQTAAALTASSGTAGQINNAVQNPAPFDGQSVVASVWLKSAAAQTVSVGVMELNSTNGSSAISQHNFAVTTAWTRCTLSGTAASALSQLSLQIGGGNTIGVGQTVYVWGAQMELAGTAGPYVPTADAPVMAGTTLTNLLTYSQEPQNWSPNPTVAVSPNIVSAPDGSMTASRVTAQSTDSNIWDGAPNAALYEGQTVTGSVYLKVDSGTLNINLYVYSITGGTTQFFTSQTAALTSVWQRFEINGLVPSSVTALALQIGGGGSFETGQVIDIWGAQMEIASHAGPYIATSALPIITGSNPTNILPSSQSISGTNWQATGTISGNAAAAPDGTNTAAIFTGTNGAAGPPATGDNWVRAFVPNPSLYDGETVTASVYLRVASGTQNVNLYLANSGDQPTQSPPSSTAQVTTTWQRFKVTGPLQDGLTAIAFQIGGGNSLPYGTSIQIWGAQFVVGTDPAPYTPTSTTTTVYSTGQVGTPVPTGLTQVYSYDSFGNIQQNGSFQTSFTANNQIFGDAYDAAGNLLSDGMNITTWDAESRLSTVGGATYIYDAEGNRVEKQGATVTDTVYFGGQPIAKYSGGQWTDLIYGPLGLLAEVPGTQTGTPVYRVTDNLGTTVGSLLANGSFVDPVDHTPFGQVFTGNTTDPYLFTGKERDAESGLDYFGARYYASSMGRFMSPDWADKPEAVPYSSLDNPQSLNLYGYVGNNPLSTADADGHCCQWFSNFGTGLANSTYRPLVQMVSHPGTTLQGIGTALSHPIATAEAMGSGIKSTSVSVMQGDGTAIGTAVGSAAMFFVPGGEEAEAAGGLSKLNLLGEAGEAASGAGISMSEAVAQGAAHVDGGVMETTGKGTNFQFRNTTTDANGNVTTKIGRFDVNPADPHVNANGPHLNMETQVNGKIQSNQHVPIDGSTVRPGDHP